MLKVGFREKSYLKKLKECTLEKPPENAIFVSILIILVICFKNKKKDHK